MFKGVATFTNEGSSQEFSFQTASFMQPKAALRMLRHEAQDGVSLGLQPVRLYLEEERDWKPFCSHIIPFQIEG
jgi:hypothetical protein